MRVCGIELSGNDAVICIMTLEEGLFNLPDCRVKKINIANPKSTEEVRQFHFTFSKLMADYKVEHVIIRERMTRGKFAGGAAGFKLEAAIQLCQDLAVSLLSPADIKSILGKAHISDNFEQTGLKQFQRAAFDTAFAFLNFKQG